MIARIAGIVVLGVLTAGLAEARPSLIVGPTVGVWQWDQEAVTGFDIVHRHGLVYGLRAGYAPIDAFAGELVVLTGTNDVDPGGGAATEGVRLVTAELSFLVHFQSVVAGPVYPFLDLGAGSVFRRGGPQGAGDNGWESSHLAFHLGGGVKADLDPRLAFRLNVRDTFYSDTLVTGSQESQVTVDSVELSVGLEYRLPLGRGRGPRRLE